MRNSNFLTETYILVIIVVVQSEDMQSITKVLQSNDEKRVILEIMIMQTNPLLCAQRINNACNESTVHTGSCGVWDVPYGMPYQLPLAEDTRFGRYTTMRIKPNTNPLSQPLISVGS